MSDRAFFYVDGEPTKGLWVDLEVVEDWDDVKALLVEHGDCDANYGGDILVCDTEGNLAKQFYHGWGTFDLEAYIEARDCGIDAEVVAAWLDNGMDFNKDEIKECYYGAFRSHADFAYDMIESWGTLPEHLRGYFDYDKFGRDMVIGGDYFENKGHYFRNQ